MHAWSRIQNYENQIECLKIQLRMVESKLRYLQPDGQRPIGRTVLDWEEKFLKGLLQGIERKKEMLSKRPTIGEPSMAQVDDSKIKQNDGIAASFTDYLVDLEELSRGYIYQLSANKVLMQADPWLNPSSRPSRNTRYGEERALPILEKTQDCVIAYQANTPSYNSFGSSIVHSMNQFGIPSPHIFPQTPTQYQSIQGGMMNYPMPLMPNRPLQTIQNPTMSNLTCRECIASSMFSPRTDDDESWLPEALLNYSYDLNQSQLINPPRLSSPLIYYTGNQGLMNLEETVIPKVNNGVSNYSEGHETSKLIEKENGIINQGDAFIENSTPCNDIDVQAPVLNEPTTDDLDDLIKVLLDSEIEWEKQNEDDSDATLEENWEDVLNMDFVNNMEWD